MVYGSPEMDGIYLESPLPPAEVVSRFGARAREWRESTLPPALRARGVYGVAVAMRGAEFRMRLKGGPADAKPVCVGRISPAAAGGGSCIRARFELGWLTRAGYCVWLVCAVGLGARGLGVALVVTAWFAILYAMDRTRTVAEREGLVWVLREAAGLTGSAAPAGHDAPAP